MSTRPAGARPGRQPSSAQSAGRFDGCQQYGAGGESVVQNSAQPGGGSQSTVAAIDNERECGNM